MRTRGAHLLEFGLDTTGFPRLESGQASTQPGVRPVPSQESDQYPARSQASTQPGVRPVPARSQAGPVPRRLVRPEPKRITRPGQYQKTSQARPGYSWAGLARVQLGRPGPVQLGRPGPGKARQARTGTARAGQVHLPTLVPPYPPWCTYPPTHLTTHPGAPTVHTVRHWYTGPATAARKRPPGS